MLSVIWAMSSESNRVLSCISETVPFGWRWRTMSCTWKVRYGTEDCKSFQGSIISLWMMKDLKMAVYKDMMRINCKNNATDKDILLFLRHTWYEQILKLQSDKTILLFEISHSSTRTYYGHQGHWHISRNSYNFWNTHTHIHTHTYIYLPIYLYKCNLGKIRCLFYLTVIPKQFNILKNPSLFFFLIFFFFLTR